MKQFMDFIGATLGLLFLAPVMLLIFVMVRVLLGSPVLYCQRRPGLGGQPFNMYKFRTMSGLRDSDDNLLSDGERLGLSGRFLRNVSLDELPELVNVLRGDMSLVGPRPLLMEYLPLYTIEQARRRK